MHGTMGLANAQRTLTYLRILVEFVSQAQYREVVPIVGIVNEILWSAIGETGVKSWYQVAYDTIREYAAFSCPLARWKLIIPLDPPAWARARTLWFTTASRGRPSSKASWRALTGSFWISTR